MMLTETHFQTLLWHGGWEVSSLLTPPVAGTWVCPARGHTGVASTAAEATMHQLSSWHSELTHPRTSQTKRLNTMQSSWGLTRERGQWVGTTVLCHMHSPGISLLLQHHRQSQDTQDTQSTCKQEPRKNPPPLGPPSNSVPTSVP